MQPTYIWRQSLLTIFLAMALTTLGAQWVAVPDTNLGTWLYNNGFSSCMTGSNATGWQIDASDPLTQVQLSIDIDYQNITSLEGLQYLSGITFLSCAGNNIPSITDLPTNLVQFDCRLSNVQSLPFTLPYGLQDLYISNNPVANSILDWPPGCLHIEAQNIGAYWLPDLPPSVQMFDCTGNQLSTLPALPAGLQQLFCSSNPITALPTTLPSGLRVLYCFSDQLVSLPALPATLGELFCATNQISSLPALPVAMKRLSCGDNIIDSLPSHLPDSLTYLECSSNRLLTVPVLPASLGYLDCANNSITHLNNIPGNVSTLMIYSNQQLSCLPRITQTLFSTFRFANTNIHCLPSRFAAQQFDVNPGSLPVCDPASGCEFYYNIAGNIHQDIAANCYADSLSQGGGLTNIKVQLRQAGNVIQQFYTFSSGGYSFQTPGYGSYTVDLDTTMLGLQVACPQSGVRAVSISAADSVKKYENFGMQCGAALSGADYGIMYMEGPGMRPGSNTVVTIRAANLSINHNMNCYTGTPGTITTTWTNGASYHSPGFGALVPTSVSPHTAVYSVADLNTLTAHSLDIVLTIDTQAAIGSQICLTTIISATPADPSQNDDTLTNCFTVISSLDPNYKTVTPRTIAPGEADWLTYTVHFQNTGNDTAYLVVLKDTLSQYVDAASFQYLASSHHAVIQLDHNAMTFTFPHINLVDSATNPPLSEGWIQYRVRANAGLPNGTAINNTAYIYFDLNPAVVTNTATTAVQLATCVDGDIYDSTTICQGDTFVYGGMTMTTTGFYYNLMQNATGCDTTYHIWLTVLPAVHTTLYDTICAGSSYAFGGHQLTAAGTYLDTLTAAGGCDSIISLVLTVRPSLQTILYDTICAGSSYAFGGHQLAAAGTYSDTLTSSGGCDSIITLALTVHATYTQVLYDTICAGSSYAFGGHQLTAAGTYSDTLASAGGCDSIISMVLAVRPLPVVTLTWDSLVQSHDLIDYLGIIAWTRIQGLPKVFAARGGFPAGGTYSGNYIHNNTFDFTSFTSPIQSGITDTVYYSYTDAYGCTAVASNSFFIVEYVGIEEVAAAAAIHIYPDPNTGTFTLVTEQSYGLSYRVSDVLGKEIVQGTISADTQPVRLPDVADGVYTISVDGARPLRFVVVR